MEMEIWETACADAIVTLTQAVSAASHGYPERRELHETLSRSLWIWACLTQSVDQVMFDLTLARLCSPTRHIPSTAHSVLCEGVGLVPAESARKFVCSLICSC